MPEIPISQAAARYAANLSPDCRAAHQQELARFVRWFGSDRHLHELNALALESYQEQVEGSGADSAQRLEPLKAFLTYCRKDGILQENLAKCVRVRQALRTKEPTTEASRVEVVELTRQGLAEMRRELDCLIREVRPQVARELYEARQDKDIRENAPYDAAKQHQALVEARIRKLERVLGAAVVLEGDDSAESVRLGSTVTLRDLVRDGEVTYTVVSSNEANPSAAKISAASPVGKALIDRQEGEEVEVQTPAGHLRYRIERIES